MIKQAEAFGEEVPEHLANPPELNIGLRIYYEAFLDLSTCRPLGMQEGPIPYTAIVEYFRQLLYLDSEQRWAGVRVVQAMDGAYMQYRNDEADKGRKIAEAATKVKN